MGSCSEVEVLILEIVLPGIIIIKMLRMDPPRFNESYRGHDTDVISCPGSWVCMLDILSLKGLIKSFDLR